MESLNFLLAGGWTITLRRDHADAYLCRGKLGLAELSVFGRDVDEALRNFENIARKFERNENERIAGK